MEFRTDQADVNGSVRRLLRTIMLCIGIALLATAAAAGTIVSPAPVGETSEAPTHLCDANAHQPHPQLALRRSHTSPARIVPVGVRGMVRVPTFDAGGRLFAAPATPPQLIALPLLN